MMPSVPIIMYLPEEETTIVEPAIIKIPRADSGSPNEPNCERIAKILQKTTTWTTAEYDPNDRIFRETRNNIRSVSTYVGYVLGSFIGFTVLFAFLLGLFWASRYTYLVEDVSAWFTWTTVVFNYQQLLIEASLIALVLTVAIVVWTYNHDKKVSLWAIPYIEEVSLTRNSIILEMSTDFSRLSIEKFKENLREEFGDLQVQNQTIKVKCSYCNMVNFVLKDTAGQMKCEKCGAALDGV